MKVWLSILLLWLVLAFVGLLHRQRHEPATRRPPTPSALVPSDPVLEGAESRRELKPGTQLSGLPATDAPPLIADPGETPVRTRSIVEEILLQLARMQNDDGSWGQGSAWLGGHRLDRVGMTGLAIIALLKEGYSHLSKDECDGVRFGLSVKNGLKWLLRNQQDDGTIATTWSGPVDHALATWALSEAYGMTATNLFKAPAQASVDALSGRFKASIDRDDESSALWMAFALLSARLGELEIPEGLAEDGLAYFGRKLSGSEGTTAAAGWCALGGGHDAAGLRAVAERLVREPPDADVPDLIGWHLKSTVLNRCRGNERELASTWNRRGRESTVRTWKSAQEPFWKSNDAVIQASLLVFNLEYRAWPFTACDCCTSSEELRAREFPDPEPK